MDPLKECFRGVVWPRDPVTDNDGKPAYRYVVVGMLVTDQPIEGLAPNETVIDGVVPRFDDMMGMTGMLSRAAKFEPTYPLGTADAVLCGLAELTESARPLAKKQD